MNQKARDILSTHGHAAFLAYCEAQRVAAERSRYEGAAEYWAAQAAMVRS